MCEKEFACARLNDDGKKYCETCFNQKTSEMMNTQRMAARDILFKSFKGNRPGASNYAFTYAKEENLFDYLVKRDPSLADILGVEGTSEGVKIGTLRRFFQKTDFVFFSLNCLGCDVV